MFLYNGIKKALIKAGKKFFEAKMFLKSVCVRHDVWTRNSYLYGIGSMLVPTESGPEKKVDTHFYTCISNPFIVY